MADGTTNSEAKYGQFAVGDASSRYALQISDYEGVYSLAGDSLTDLSGRSFSTRGDDQDGSALNCA